MAARVNGWTGQGIVPFQAKLALTVRWFVKKLALMTLQSGYFEDFKWGPKVLLWGDTLAMSALTEFLRQIGAGADTMVLGHLCQAVDGREIAIRVAASSSGMCLKDGRLEWTLSPEKADDFTEMVEVLTLSSEPGHQYLKCEVDGEITVMVSCGEYPVDLRPTS